MRVSLERGVRVMRRHDASRHRFFSFLGAVAMPVNGRFFAPHGAIARPRTAQAGRVADAGAAWDYAASMTASFLD